MVLLTYVITCYNYSIDLSIGVLMPLSTLTKVGNSMAVLLPKALRQEACIEPDVPLRINSPREGVVVITAVYDDSTDRLTRLQEAEERIASRKVCAEWPEGKTADDLLRAGKERMTREITAL